MGSDTKKGNYGPIDIPVEPAPQVPPSGPKKEIKILDFYGGDVIDWNKIDKSVIFAAIGKASQGAHNTQRNFTAYRLECRRLGIPFSPYHFFDASAGGLEQAQHFCAVVGDLVENEFGPVLDWEAEGTKASHAEAKVFLDYIEKRYNRVPWFYSYVSFIKDLHLPPSYARYPLWLAHYHVKKPTIPAPWTNYIAWQYEDDEHLPGQHGSGDTGGYDMSVFNGSEEDLRKLVKK